MQQFAFFQKLELLRISFGLFICQKSSSNDWNIQVDDDNLSDVNWIHGMVLTCFSIWLISLNRRTFLLTKLQYHISKTMLCLYRIIRLSHVISKKIKCQKFLHTNFKAYRFFVGFLITWCCKIHHYEHKKTSDVIYICCVRECFAFHSALIWAQHKSV